ncbi:Top3a [Symbiodinium necroappetens]|uniref:Top3a protein n=1 Tax=Symbiodinium necroappetens TaxID=1628268 RepID=A0A813C0S5_9DINO|nr:Top3a [Symbiodinium necroappetens]
MMRTRRATMGWRVLGEKLSDLVKLIELRAQVQDWLPSSSLQRLGLPPSQAALRPSTPTSAPTAPIKAKQADAELEYAEVIKYASFLGVRQSKMPAQALVTERAHPREDLKGAGNQYKREIYCGKCMGRWQHLTPEELHKKKMEVLVTPSPPSRLAASSGSMTSGPMTTLCLCNKPAFRWQVKKKGPTHGRHFYKCQSRICDFFLWDPVE